MQFIFYLSFLFFQLSKGFLYEETIYSKGSNSFSYLVGIRDAHDRWRRFWQWSRGLEVVRMHRDLSSYACRTRKHLCTERTTSDSLMFCHQRLSIANRTEWDDIGGRIRWKMIQYQILFVQLSYIGNENNGTMYLLYKVGKDDINNTITRWTLSHRSYIIGYIEDK